MKNDYAPQNLPHLRVEKLVFLAGQSLWDCFRRHIVDEAGDGWVEEDLVSLYNLAVSSTPDMLQVLCDCRYQWVNPNSLMEKCSFLGELAEVPGLWNRLALGIRQYMSEPKELERLGTKKIAIAISNKALQALKHSSSSEFCKKVDDFLASFLQAFVNAAS